MAKREGKATPKLGDIGGDDATYNPRSRASDVTQEKEPGFPAHGGPKPMLDFKDKLKHLGGK
jgi:hypothetical protein